MAAPTLIKQVSESRLYAFDFGAAAPAGPRGTVWGQSLLATGESLTPPPGPWLPALPLPLSLMSAPQTLMLPLSLLTAMNAPAPGVSVARADGGPADLTLGTPRGSGTQVLLRVAGGTDGQMYRLTCAALSPSGNLLIVQGRLLVVATLP